MFGSLGFNASMGKRQKLVVSSPKKSPKETSKEIPVDVLIDIFTKLPLEAVARCRCVSKMWSSVLRHGDFTQLYLKKSSVRPRILLTFLCNGKRMFYSIPQDLDPNRDYSSPIIPDYQMHFPKGLRCYYDVCPSIHGFICTESRKPLICNPSTGEYMSLPIATTKRHQTRTCFGYDPVAKLFKVLCVSNDYVYRVATVGTEKVTWRRVKCSTPHQPLCVEICIGGILYYLAEGVEVTPRRYMVACFDVRVESYKFVVVESLLTKSSALVNYHGKLGILFPYPVYPNIGEEGFELRVLEDANETKWSRTVYILPCYWRNLVGRWNPDIVGMTNAGEIVFSKYSLVEPFYVYYFNTVKKTVVRVEIDFGTVAKKAYYKRVSTLVNHVENVELMD